MRGVSEKKRKKKEEQGVGGEVGAKSVRLRKLASPPHFPTVAAARREGGGADGERSILTTDSIHTLPPPAMRKWCR
jgi:hypothetical protein